MPNIDYSIQYRRWNETTPEFYELQARGYDRWLGDTISGLPLHGNILDYGCGFGLLSHYLRKRFTNVLSIDSSAEQLAVAKANGLNTQQVSPSEFQSWTLDNAQRFDVIFLFDVLEHVPVQLQIDFVQMLSTTLKVGGQLYIKVPNANSLLASRWRYIDWTHTSSFTEASLDFVCLNAGLGQPDYLADDSSVKPRWLWLPRWNLRQYYVRGIFRSLWRLYLHSELGTQAKHISVGYNLFARAIRTN